MDFSLSEPERDLVGLCRDFAQKEIAARAPAGMGRGAVPDRPAARDGRARAARHARARGVGRHRHVDGRVRGRHGADRPGRPVGRRRLAGPRDDRLVAAPPVRRRRPAGALAAPAGRGPRARGVRTDRARRRLRRPGHPHPGRATRRRLGHQRAQDLHLQRRDRHVLRRHAAGPDRSRRRRRAGRRATPASWWRRTRPGSPWARRCAASAGAASTPASCSSTTSGCPTTTSSATPTMGLEPVPAHPRGRPHLDRRPVAQPDPGRARPGHGRTPVSACSSASPSPSSRPCSSSWPTSPPSSRRPAGSPTGPPPCATPAQPVPQGGGHGQAQGQPAGGLGGVGGGADPRRPRLHARHAGGPLLLRRQGPRDRRGDQRDPAPRHRPRPRAAEGRPHTAARRRTGGGDLGWRPGSQARSSSGA